MFHQGWLILLVVLWNYPDHIARMAEAVKDMKPSGLPHKKSGYYVFGLEPMIARDDLNFINIGERNKCYRFRCNLQSL
ncbi:MAG: hypothetical protein IPL63_10705 [Saprospiraceae bacterium]|nr:hypothetical protein [Saprospiraceae bacterium]